MAESVFESICRLLDARRVAYRTVHHEPTPTSEASGGAPVAVGGTALLMKTGAEYRLFVVSAARRVDSAAIKRHLAQKKLRFASAEELGALTGLVPGAVPPFGRPILPFELFVDPSIVANDRIAFNAGSLTHSIILSVEDYLTVAKPVIFPFAQQPK